MILVGVGSVVFAVVVLRFSRIEVMKIVFF